MSHSPTDQELMLYVDGELDVQRAGEIDAALAADPRARAVVGALRRAAEALASDALERAEASGADSIVDGVMAAVEAEGGTRKSERGTVREFRRSRATLGAF